MNKPGEEAVVVMLTMLIWQNANWLQKTDRDCRTSTHGVIKSKYYSTTIMWVFVARKGSRQGLNRVVDISVWCYRCYTSQRPLLPPLELHRPHTEQTKCRRGLGHMTPLYSESSFSHKYTAQTQIFDPIKTLRGPVWDPPGPRASRSRITDRFVV